MLLWFGTIFLTLGVAVLISGIFLGFDPSLPAVTMIAQGWPVIMIFRDRRKEWKRTNR